MTNSEVCSVPVIPIQTNRRPAQVKQVPAVATSFGQVLWEIKLRAVESAKTKKAKNVTRTCQVDVCALLGKRKVVWDRDLPKNVQAAIKNSGTCNRELSHSRGFFPASVLRSIRSKARNIPKLTSKLGIRAWSKKLSARVSTFFQLTWKSREARNTTHPYPPSGTVGPNSGWVLSTLSITNTWFGSLFERLFGGSSISVCWNKTTVWYHYKHANWMIQYWKKKHLHEDWLNMYVNEVLLRTVHWEHSSGCLVEIPYVFPR